MKRRDFCLLSGASLLSALATNCQKQRAVNNSFSTRSSQPNVLFISIDDLNDWVGVLKGHPQAKTPHLDRLANQGILFSQAYCSAPSCNASRTAVLTGIEPYRSGLYDNKTFWRKILPDAVTIPQLFQQNGYQVKGAGKIYHNGESLTDIQREGWNDYFPSNGAINPGPFPDNPPLNGLPNPGIFDWGPISNQTQDMYDVNVASWIIEQLQTLSTESDERPFFLACGFFRPHLPWYLPSKYFDEFPLENIQLPIIKDDDLNDIPLAGVKLAHPQDDHSKVLKHNQYQQAVQAYLASIYFMDEMLGQVLTALDASPYRDNTIVVLWSDHGWHLGEKLHWRKFTLWEEATRIPLIFRFPPSMYQQNNQLGQVCSRPVSLIDIYPTLIELCGLNLDTNSNADIDGRSIVPLLKNPAAEWNYPAITTWSAHSSVRSEQFRLIRYSDGTEEFYDHQTDPNEWTNLAGDPAYSGIKNELATWLPDRTA
ncbi:MAG: sulfatase [Thainema sp.]